ncbi:MAG: hypothetical protein AAGA56_20610, partial [Myxococcota bacterium]
AVVDVAPAPQPSVTVAAPSPSASAATATAGYTRDRGRTLRIAASSCRPLVQGKACSGEGIGDRGPAGQCRTDADCKDGPYGRCVVEVAQVGAFCGCRYSCANDSDCDPGEVCVCSDAAELPHQTSTCVPASCRSADDCKSGACEVSVFNNGCWNEMTVACRSERDECASDADCSDGTRCVYTKNRAWVRATGGEGHWRCAGISCAIGRPLVTTAGDWATAPVRPRNDWGASFCLAEHPPEAAARARAHYLEVAALEHASVASFARFQLQLLALGAPAALVEATAEAMRDEIHHAQLAYGIATALGSTAQGPGALKAATAPLATDPVAIARALLEEGCVGETLGAVEAERAAARCTDHALRSALQTIALDEADHACLAWRCLRWLLETYPEVRHALADLPPPIAPSVPVVGQAVPSLGMLSAEELVALRRDAMVDVVRPALALVLEAGHERPPVFFGTGEPRTDTEVERAVEVTPHGPTIITSGHDGGEKGLAG